MNEGEMSVPAMGAETVLTGIDTEQFKGIGPSDLREFLDRIERGGELKRITAEVDPIEEMSAIVYLAARENGAPAFLFERVKGYDIPAKGSFELKPNGSHLMLVDLKRPLKEGEKVPVVLKFEKAGEVEVEFQVAPLGGSGPGHAGH